MKLIFLWGPSGSGKTSSIHAAMKLVGIDPLFDDKDTTITVPAYRKDGALRDAGIGFATGGDTLAQIEENLAHFAGKDLSCIVMACRTKGKTVKRLEKFAAAEGIEPIWIETKRVTEDVRIYVGKMGAEIVTHIP